MTVKLNKKAFDHAKHLIRDGKVVKDTRDDWSEHAPSAKDESAFLDKHGHSEYSKWFLGVDDDHPDDQKGHYKFPIGDFKKIHRCGVISAESRAGQYDYDDIRDALGKLLEKIDED
ncbi:hypothetical protein [Paenarthrobacter nitroguajacolicus]|uniref:hypothetical protein n=1 Tax=Paenarthrobacter nitroguajacolicus TaxID=211146 RepID=UPI0015BB06F7|nr:hypothetical protein [Paenarthrobacter nitroguajacolicus]NWL11458.1 hypothetical protein [Paenarthrobacter nitroguajacolicus]NWL33698.1 hypothetical protein [Paenarthrobacter nitroguajacolicus]